MENLLGKVDKIEPFDPKVKEEYNQFKYDVTKQAIESLRERIPKRIIYFNTLVNVNAEPGTILDVSDLDTNTYKYTTNQTEENIRKKHKTNDHDVIEKKKDSIEMNSKNDTHYEEKKIVVDENVIYTHYVPSHKQINAELEKIKAYSSELIEIIGNIKLWIQLNVPRIEDGNNFGVGIQEEAIQELARVEESAFNLYDAIVKYYMDRAKLSTKVIKYPNVYDYQEAVRELDEKEWVHIKITIIDMRNNYIMLYDLLCKNWEKVVKPKNEDAHHRMTF
ncbi:subunit of proteaseome activator complex, putative [Plasmodium vivax]|uniref:Proteasome activator complex subunit 3, putative n=6 Tax=Plasmodium vivax TaxID=5855 RepID=A5K6E7_PLAVS|nr:proteasome activator complex subunit 3, putative [Plasmodium vivax]KMZ81342.1 proteasome activator complex subunit 3 [Plasmodium vivax India VII]KMZ87563.1 proteasome activator complex subunit 3 [Plasmodium vivax Brazil I]KMZ93885.1 proteasome activator complex subunit 3 [Plasmodium vivax Mauritania I]KNA00528.1 proteasome activator complex subunit 3 [Plasmodium vivax North Korean]EDL44888.1 proteasome activator complex subunit 3, putative [Plasmodium vivax]|eukprot:XP_001614615.1 proteasome activator complex subunit 3 [Plasmodium vivax Sal-1]